MGLVYLFEADVIEMVPVGLVPEGARFDVYFSGQLVEGPLSGATLRGIDYLLFRYDGIGVVNAHEIITTNADHQHVSIHAQGYITPFPEMQLPPPEELLSPEFRWPDVPLPAHGFVLYRTGAVDLAWMNRTTLAFGGTVNVGTRKLVIEVRASKSAASE